jgi:hypothetical protein
VQQALAPHRFELIEQRAEWLGRIERRIGKYLTSGAEVDPAKIRPRLELVTTEKQHDIWRYCRLWGSIPYNRGCGRLLRYLLRDDGQPGSPLMGIIALSSPVLISKPRDGWIGWEYPKDVDVKRERLLACVDLSVSMAIPPYNVLTGGKLICLAALSNEVRRDYLDKFSEVRTPLGLQEGRLALITTTSLYGSSVQYNRLRVDDRAAYKHVGYTSGYGNAHLTEEEFGEMEEYLQEIGKPIPKGWGTGRSYRLRVYSAYCRHRYGEKHAPAHEHPRSVYVAPLAANSREFLQKETDALDSYDLPLVKLVNQWRERWLASRLAKPEVVDRFRAEDPRQSLLSSELAAHRRRQACLATAPAPKTVYPLLLGKTPPSTLA